MNKIMQIVSIILAIASLIGMYFCVWIFFGIPVFINLFFYYRERQEMKELHYSKSNEKIKSSQNERDSD